MLEFDKLNFSIRLGGHFRKSDQGVRRKMKSSPEIHKSNQGADNNDSVAWSLDTELINAGLCQ